MVDYAFYTAVYFGSVASENNFAMLEAKAADIVAAATRYAVTAETIATLPDIVQSLYKKAICAQVDYIALNGYETLVSGEAEGFTVGKVTVQAGSATRAAGAITLSPLAVMYLEQSGLLYAGIAVAPSAPLTPGWWY